MFSCRTAAGLLLALALPAAPLAAQTHPEPGPGDARMRQVRYSPVEVIQLTGHLGYLTMIEFAPSERVESVSLGDSLGWQVTPNKRANLLFVKPVEKNSRTNMVVVTNQRRYAFDLRAAEAKDASDPNIVYVLRFILPPAPSQPTVLEIAPPVEVTKVDPLARIEKLNFAYQMTGKLQVPLTRVFDDGRETYFLFPAGSDAPAILAITGSGSEELVNQRMMGQYTVVDRIARGFVLRYGERRTLVRNETLAPVGSPGFASK